MIILLPPSETKRDGGNPAATLDLGSLSFPALTSTRKSALASLRRISRSVAASTVALGLGPTQRHEVERNRTVSVSPTLPAVERYTGVLYDAIGVASLSAEARAWVGETVVIHSALFGLIGADDPIPAYRFSHDTKLPDGSITRLWRGANQAALAARADFVLDLRSEAYTHLGPAPRGSYFLRVVSQDGAGRRRALNHFNKHGKGEFVRELALSDARIDRIDDLFAWARAANIDLRPGSEGELELTV